MELGVDDLDATQPSSRLDVDRNTATLVGDEDGPALFQGDGDTASEPGQGLVHTVVEDLPQTVHEAAGVRRPDVHGGTLSDSLKTFENKNVSRLVVPVRRSFRCCPRFRCTRSRSTLGQSTLGRHSPQFYRGGVPTSFSRTRQVYRTGIRCSSPQSNRCSVLRGSHP